MGIVVAKTAGFCMGVRRAVDMALDAPTKHALPICTYGPLIHNPQVLAMFAERGVSVMETIPFTGEGTILVRAHGVPPITKRQLKRAGFNVIDATCPRVVKVQSIIKRHASKGYAAIIVGDQDHPEVISLLGFAGERGYVVSNVEALAELPLFQNAIVVAQTTQDKELYGSVKEWVTDNRRHYKVFDTICDSTEKRQAEVRRLAELVDAVVVVGGKQSGNTRRLAEIVAASGRPAFHVETEAELDFEALSEVRNIGVTAGASTPTWMIKRVVRAIDRMPLTRQGGVKALLMRLQRLALLTNFYLALGAGCLAYAATHLQAVPTAFPAIFSAVLYVMSMHILNHLTGRDEDRYNDPDRERFYQRNKIMLTVLALAAGTAGLVAAFMMGALPFWVLLFMSLLGLSYNLRFIPPSLLPKSRLRRIRDIPGSKTILIALAWSVVTAGLPYLAAEEAAPVSGLLTIIWAAGFAFSRTAFFDVLDMQGDRIVGKETIPILLGTERSLRLLKGVLVAMIVLPAGGALSGILPPLAYLLAACPAALWAIVALQERGTLFPGMQLEFMVESLFVLTGLVTFFYSLVI